MISFCTLVKEIKSQKCTKEATPSLSPTCLIASPGTNMPPLWQPTPSFDEDFTYKLQLLWHKNKRSSLFIFFAVMFLASSRGRCAAAEFVIPSARDSSVQFCQTVAYRFTSAGTAFRLLPSCLPDSGFFSQSGFQERTALGKPPNRPA